MDWKEEYKNKLISPQEAAGKVKSGDYVALVVGTEPMTLKQALASRKEELRDVSLYVAGGRDFPWFHPGWEESFQIETIGGFPAIREMLSERRAECLIGTVFGIDAPCLRRQVDFLLIALSPPDEHGFCSFGASVWNKREAIKSAKVAIAEINKNMIRTFGDNSIHISEIDYFVEHAATGKTPGTADLLGRKEPKPTEEEKTTIEYVSTLIKDGDTLEIGVGGVAEWMAKLGVLDNKQNLGWHSENTPRGIVTLIRQGVINGKKKTIHPGKAVTTSVIGNTKEDLDFINMNPLFELYGSEYVLNPTVIAAHDNMVAVNSALSVDLTGQINAESIGPIIVGMSGGQLPFAIGSNLSKGGRNISTLLSTAKGGTISRIVPQFDPGTIITVPRTLADIIVTEYGIAKLKGKTARERALELIAIAHPDFRAELKKEAERLFWPET